MKTLAGLMIWERCRIFVVASDLNFKVIERLQRGTLAVKSLSCIHTFQPSGFTVIHLNHEADLSSISIAAAMELFDLPDLQAAIEEHFYFHVQEGSMEEEQLQSLAIAQ
jgi:hypothetical protein